MPETDADAHTEAGVGGSFSHRPPTCPTAARPAFSLWPDLCPHSRPKGTAGLESELVCLDAWSADTAGEGDVSDAPHPGPWGFGAAGAMGAVLLRDRAGLAMV